jgi:hypothetical protein
MIEDEEDDCCAERGTYSTSPTLGGSGSACGRRNSVAGPAVPVGAPSPRDDLRGRSIRINDSRRYVQLRITARNECCSRFRNRSWEVVARVTCLEVHSQGDRNDYLERSQAAASSDDEGMLSEPHKSVSSGTLSSKQ